MDRRHIAASLLAQLLTALLFLFLPWDPLVEAVILSCLLLVGQGCAVLGEGRLEQADKTERLLGIVYWIRKVMSAIFAAAVFHLAVIVLAGVFPIPGLVRGLAALVLIVTCICGVLLLWRAESLRKRLLRLRSSGSRGRCIGGMCRAVCAAY